MTEVNFEAFTQLKRVLNESIEGKLKSKFDMYGFVEVHKCGTSACAAGSAGLDPWFRSQGFKSVKSHQNVEYRVNGFTYTGFGATEEFFGITDRDAGRLFDPAEYSANVVTEQDVLKRIDEVLHDKLQRKAILELEMQKQKKFTEDCRFIKMLLADMARTGASLSEAVIDLEQDKIDTIKQALIEWSNAE